MSQLVLVELQRILARRVVRLFVAAAFLGIAIGGLVAYLRADSTYLLTGVKGILQGTTVPFVLAAWVLGASAIGAEWRGGTVATLLSWEPRRVRVMVSKVLAVMIVATVMTILFQGAIAGSLLPAALLKGTTVGADSGWLRSVIGLVLRGAALAAMASAVGFAIGSAGRNTAFALGVGFVYLAVLEGGLLGSIFPGIRRWLLVGNAIVMVTGRTDLDIAGRSVAGAGFTLAVYAVGALAVATALFSSRDVK